MELILLDAKHIGNLLILYFGDVSLENYTGENWESGNFSHAGLIDKKYVKCIYVLSINMYFKILFPTLLDYVSTKKKIVSERRLAFIIAKTNYNNDTFCYNYFHNYGSFFRFESYECSVLERLSRIGYSIILEERIDD